MISKRFFQEICFINLFDFRFEKTNVKEQNLISFSIPKGMIEGTKLKSSIVLYISKKTSGLF